MNYINKKFSLAKTPTVSDIWKKKTDIERIALIKDYLKKNKNIDLEVVRAEPNGQVTLKIEKIIPANERGVMLLDFEEELKKSIDQGITVWLEPVGDKSKLRNLRGITIKAI